MADQITLNLAHSPDPDDAFMWWPLFEINGERPRLETGRFRFEPVMQDIESLNRRSDSGEFEITAMSCAQYARVADRYAITSCGASMGENYGPKLISREAMVPADVCADDIVVAIPGERTSAFAALCMMLGRGRFRWEEADFKQIIDLVADGTFAVGLIIHEGQLTFEQQGLHLIEDMGQWWYGQTGLPLPLGVNTVRLDLEDLYGPGTLAELTTLLQHSVEYALAHRGESVKYALDWARDMTVEQADEFIGLYVNKWTLQFGEVGEQAVRKFLGSAAEHGALPSVERVRYIAPELSV